ncbi:MAG: hypothetical protein ACYC6Y_19615, partial [Thermoguttaceae bacterium]
MVRQLGILAFVPAAIAALSSGTLPVQAADFGCAPYAWSTPYPTDLSDLYNVGAIPRPPYFALHPPVYYSAPVPR